MKISKRQLRQIIKEEKAKLLRESVTDMVQFENTVDQALGLIMDQFYENMVELMDEPGPLQDLPDAEQSINEATAAIYSRLKKAINDIVMEVENGLISGRY